MNALHDALALIERDAAADFQTTDLADDLSPVTSAVRRGRFARATAAVGATAAMVVGGLWAVNTFGMGADAGPAATDDLGPAPSTPVESPATATLYVTSSTTVPQIAAALASHYGITVEEALANLDAAIPIPDAQIDGWIPTNDYDLSLYDSASTFAEAAVANRIDHLEALGVPESEWQRALTFASLVEVETPLPVNMPSVARVIQNRLDAGMELQLDSTVQYVTGGSEVFITDAERQIDSPYNTYLYAGLPPGPIASPSYAALEAALNPEEGPWYFFVVVDLSTGEMVFSDNYESHLVNVRLLQEWIDAQAG